MTELLSTEERTALQAPYTGAPAPLTVSRAIFPSAAQLDPHRAAALSRSLKRWLDAVALDLSRQLRVNCALQPPDQEVIAPAALPLPDEEPFWAMLTDVPDSYLLISLPRVFAAALCERVFGAPFELRGERALTPAELTLLGELAGGWLSIFPEAWPGVIPCPGSAPESLNGEGGTPAGDWIRFNCPLIAGPATGQISVTLAPKTIRALLGEAPHSSAKDLTASSLGAHLGEVSVEMRAVLGQAEFSLDELSSLRIGDVIALDRRAQDPVDIFIQDRALFRARAGLAGQVVAIELIGAPGEER